MKKYILILLCFVTVLGWSQDEPATKKKESVVISSMINGKVLNASDNVVLENVHVVNLNSVKGTLTNEEGGFMMKAEVNDTLYFSYLGFKSIRVRVTNDWLNLVRLKLK